MITALAKYRPPCHDRKLEFAVRHYDYLKPGPGETGRELRLKLVVLEALERLDRLVDSIPADFPFDDRVSDLLRYDLEYFPSRTAFNPGENVPADHTKIGHAVEIMEQLLRRPEITEDEIQRVQATCYCRYPYGRAEAYRQKFVFRKQWGHLDIPLSMHLVPREMRELVEWVNSPRALALHPFLRAVMFYARYDRIHPFSGQTKQVGRFFMARILLLGQNGRRYPPLLTRRDFDDFLKIKVPEPDQRESLTSHELIRYGRTTELALQLLCLYVDKLDKAFYGDYAHRGLNDEMAGLIYLLNPETRDFFELKQM